MQINLDDDDDAQAGSTFESNYKLFCQTGHLGPFKGIIKSMMSIKPTSTDVERTFSLSGYIVAPRRRKMRNDLLDAIVVINKFYKM